MFHRSIRRLLSHQLQLQLHTIQLQPHSCHLVLQTLQHRLIRLNFSKLGVYYLCHLGG